MSGGRGGPGGPSFSGRGGGRPTSLGPRDQGRGRSVLLWHLCCCISQDVKSLARIIYTCACFELSRYISLYPNNALLSLWCNHRNVNPQKYAWTWCRGQGRWKKTLNGRGGDGRGQHKNNGNYFGAKGEQLQGPAAPSGAMQKVMPTGQTFTVCRLLVDECGGCHTLIQSCISSISNIYASLRSNTVHVVVCRKRTTMRWRSFWASLCSRMAHALAG